MSWFPPPKPIETKVFTSMPEHFRRPRRSAWADANKGGAPIDSFLEGPAFDRDGNLYVTDIPHGRVFRIDQGGEWSLVAEYDGWPNGLKIGRDGRILITDYRKGLMALDPATGTVTPHLETVGSEGFRGVNDLAFAANGDIYFTDQGQTGMQDPTGRVYRLTADGRLDRLLSTCPSPNGLVLNKAGTHLYVALTRSCQIWRMAVGRDSIVGKANVFAQLPGGVSGPDGLAMDEEDGLAICDPGHGCVWILDRWGVPTHIVQSCAGRTLTNLAYGGPGRSQLFITDSETGQVLVAEAPVPGRALVSHEETGA
ncbi:SMP-30/gluconolactonase/LRE family protein [Telmatospirillum sp. J64-1]|uniref:SMP-30/gluconolactonase/LRE family protein n=1 Tax=Telmatospirillum sp. J64-1 TaxID=2502183 RepID=UPI00115D41F6|nr:SMP-30/gluconolactonase/LRE family protein [Telmatospirillum sp. J64-1]